MKTKELISYGSNFGKIMSCQKEDENGDKLGNFLDKKGVVVYAEDQHGDLMLKVDDGEYIVADAQNESGESRLQLCERLLKEVIFSINNFDGNITPNN